MNLKIADIRPSYDDAKQRGSSYLIVFRNTRNNDLEIVHVAQSQDPDRVAGRYAANRTAVHVKTIDLSQNLETQIQE